MKFKVFTSDGAASQKTVEGAKAVFEVEPNEHVVHLAVKAELNNMRQGSVSTKTRGEVRGGGKKPWKQKGRGTARSGSSRSPVWVGGGHTFALSPKQYRMRLPRKVRRLARRSVLSDKAQQKAIHVVESFTFETPRTADMIKLLKGLDLYEKKLLILTAEFQEALYLSARNLRNVAVIEAASASAYDLIDNEAILMDKASIAVLNDQLAN